MTAERADGRRWSAHPWAARGLRLLVFGLPILASVAFVQTLTSFTGAPTNSLWVFLGWWFGVSLLASGVVSVLYALTRRLLPLGALLGLSLVFPDEAPSRFRLALAAGTVESLERRLSELHEADAQQSAEILLQLVAALDVHDRITRGHAERVRGYAASLGRQLGLPKDDLDRLNWSALLHDVGKLKVDAEILNKPGRPTDEEWAKLRRHPLEGEALAEPLRRWLGEWADAIGYHHENWDGTGYPRGTVGEAIPLGGRIVAIADVFDVITSARSYKRPATPAEARVELVRCAGTQFDPRLVRAFVNISLGRMRRIVGPLAWLSNAPLLVRLPLTPSLGATVGGIAALASAATAGPAVAEQPEAVPHIPVAVVAAVRGPAPASPLFVPHDPSPVIEVRAVRRTGRTPVRLHPGHAPAAPKVATTTHLPPKRPSPPPPAAAPSAPPPTTTTKAAPPTTTTRTPAPPPPTTTTTPAPPTTTTNASPPPTLAPPPANVAPSFMAGGSQTVPEDSGAHTVSGWATAISPGPGTETSQTVTFTVSTDNASLFSAAPAVSPDGTLTYTSAPDANGVAHVTVSAVDDGGTANGGHDTSVAQAFTITVDSVNDGPTFTPGPNQTAVSLLGAQAVNDWATAISPGPADESSQSVSFKVSVSNSGLFAVQPALSPSGKLTYTPKLLALGTATVTVTPVDNGGSEHGGQDTGVPRTFTITII